MAAMWNFPANTSFARKIPPKMSAAALAAQRGQRGGKVAMSLRSKVAAMEAAALASTPGFKHQSQRQGPQAEYFASLCAVEEARERAAVTVQASYRGFRARKRAAAMLR